MSAVSEIIVREYFELNGFFVHQQRKYIPRTEEDDEEIDFMVYNPRHQNVLDKLPMILTSESIQYIGCAIVSVKGWHTEVITPSIVKRMESDLIRLVGKESEKYITQLKIQPQSLLKIVVIPALTTNAEQREKTLQMFSSLGINSIIQFKTILNELIEKVQVNHNYSKSDVLQTIRILKAYDLFKEPQMMLFEGRKKRTTKSRTKANSIKDESGKSSIKSDLSKTEG